MDQSPTGKGKIDIQSGISIVKRFSHFLLRCDFSFSGAPNVERSGEGRIKRFARICQPPLARIDSRSIRILAFLKLMELKCSLVN